MEKSEVEYLKEQVHYFEQLYRKVIENNGSMGLQIIELKNELQKCKKELDEFKNKSFVPVPTRKISDVQVQEIKKLREQGLSYSQIVKKTMWSKFTISRVLNGIYD